MVVYVLNVPPVPAGSGVLKVTPVSIEEVKKVIANGAQCFIVDPIIAKYLEIEVTYVDPELRKGDIAYVLRGYMTHSGELKIKVSKIEYLK